MKNNRSNHNNQFEINDLIDDARENAVARRNQGLNSEADLSDLSIEEAKSVAGGLTKIPTICGFICPPIVLGIRYVPTETI